MKRKGLFWKIIVGIITALLIVIVTFLGIKLYKNKYGESWCREKIGYSSEKVFYNRGGVRIFNTTIQKYTTPKVDWIAIPEGKDTLTVFSEEGKRGYVNLLTGKIMIPEHFERAWLFSEGVAAVIQDNKLGFINTKGEIAIPFRFSYNPDIAPKIDFLFKDGYCTAPGENGKYGLIDKKANWILSPEYDYITNPVKGYRVVEKEKHYGVIGPKCQPVIPIQYNWIKVTNDGFLIMKDDIQYLLSFDGKNIIQPFVYDELNEIHYTSQQVTEDGSDITIRSDYTSFKMHDCWGVMDKNGKVIIPAQYSEITAINNDLFSCQKEGYTITINSKGAVVH